MEADINQYDDKEIILKSHLNELRSNTLSAKRTSKDKKKKLSISNRKSLFYSKVTLTRKSVIEKQI